MYILRHLKIVTKDSMIDDGYIVIDRGKIVDIGRGSPAVMHGVVEDLYEYTALPGFIDTHVHGIEGLDITSNPSPETIIEMSMRLVKYGVTSFVPTTVTAPHEVLLAVCRAIYEAKNLWRPGYGARILGVHLEGPYISREMAGAQNPNYIRSPSIQELKEYMEASRGNIVQITIAPEIEKAIELILYAKQHGIVVSAGHTNASYEEGVRAIEVGVTKATHLFNAMRRLHHRDPGIALALIESPNVYLELIVDYIHVHPALVNHIVRYAGADRIVLITDAIAAAGLSDGDYELGGLRVRVNQGIAKLIDKNTLAGSTLTMHKAFQNVLRLGFSIIEASKMSSITPARSIGICEKLQIGKLEKGYKADIVVMDEDLQIRRVYIEGEVVYEK